MDDCKWGYSLKQPFMTDWWMAIFGTLAVIDN
jgi:hypothetical protein